MSMYNVHCVQKITPTYVFDYNSGVSWSIFILFVPVEREMNTVQFSYLQSWWRHNCVTLHATKVYFIELLLNIKYIEFRIEFEDKILIKNLWKCKKNFCQKTDKKFCTKKIKKMNIRWLSAKVANNGFDRTHSRKRSDTIVSKCDVFTLGSVVNFVESL